ncbi:MAG: glycosyltransferase family 2 protein [Bacteroidota bacterium]
MDKQLISIVLPIYNEEESIEEMIKTVFSALKNIDYQIELLCINDGSKDNTLFLLDKMAKDDPRIRIINLARNFGHQLAVTAGVDQSKGDCAIVIDADLQDPPELIISMIEKWKEGYQVVYAKRKVRKGEPLLRLWAIKIFYRVLKRVTNVDIPLDTGDFRLMDKQVIENLKNMPERYRFIRGMVSWVGFNQIGIEYDRNKRYRGKSKYPFTKLLSLALNGIVSFSFAPLRIATFLGFIVSIVSFIYALYILYQKFINDLALQGWASLMIVILFLGGLQLLTLGIIGEYVGRTNIEVKKRPIYIIKEIINYEQSNIE